MEEFYITTPIYYVNDKPHIGHAYTTIAADTLARWRAAKGENVRFSTGVDENAQKTVNAAAKNGEDVHAYADRMAGIWESAWRELGISYTDFIRTTDKRHAEVVKDLWRRLDAAGDIYKDRYEGLYCVGHEAFMKPEDLTPEGLCPEHKTKPEMVSEENYYFALSKYEKRLLEFYEANPDFVAPPSRFNEVRSFVERGLEDVSFSREKRAWGIPVPDDPGQVIYVWADALANYITAAGGAEGWEQHPADMHMVGKDILKFHGIIWPAMLMSAGLPLPGQVAANGFLTIDGMKMGKSLGNAIDPMELSRKYGRDAMRYFLLREIPYGEDGDFSEEKLRERYNGDLANGLGNFAARVLALAENEDFTGMDGGRPDDDLAREAAEMDRKVAEKLASLRFGDALVAVWAAISAGDRYVNEKKIWDMKDVEARRSALYGLVTLLRAVSEALGPFLPDTAAKIKGAIGTEGGLKAKRIEILFPRMK